MTREALPPLLRGIGTTLILIAALVAFAITHRHVEKQKEMSRALSGSARPVPGISELTKEIAELRTEVEEDSAVEEVLENLWFEWLGFLGTATIASSFFVEWYVRSSKPAKKGTASWN